MEKSDEARFKSMIKPLQQMDPMIDGIVAYSKFVVGYLLQQDGPNPGWKKANIEGPVYLVRRRQAPKYQVLVKNQFSTNDLWDNVHPEWELDCQQNYIFYKVENPAQKIRGLWFHDDAERQKIQSVFEATLKEMRSPAVEVPQAPVPQVPAQVPAEVSNLGPMKAQPYGDGNVTVTTATLRTALHALADDEQFLQGVMQKLRDAQAHAARTTSF